MELAGIQFVLWGSKGHAMVLDEIIRLRGGRVVALFDRQITKSAISGVPVYKGEAAFREWVEANGRKGSSPIAAIAAIGGSGGEARCGYLRLFRDVGCAVPSLIHPTAFVSDNAVLGSNCQVLGGAHVGVRSEIGDCSIVNSSASVDHECRLDDGVHIAPGATLCGCVTVASNTLVGAGAVVLPRVRIGKNVTIGAGSIVTRDVPDDVVAVGNPARIIAEANDGQ